jgi:HSP20 family molecular chaperone IbpA
VRRLRLPDTVAADRITATIKDGELELTIPKAPAPEHKKIEVQVA